MQTVTTAAARAWCRKTNGADWHKTSAAARKKLLARARAVLAAEAADAIRCAICLDKEKTVVVVPCGHKCMCVACAKQLQASLAPRCPLCRGALERITRVFE